MHEHLAGLDQASPYINKLFINPALYDTCHVTLHKSLYDFVNQTRTINIQSTKLPRRLKSS